MGRSFYRGSLYGAAAASVLLVWCVADPKGDARQYLRDLVGRRLERLREIVRV